MMPIRCLIVDDDDLDRLSLVAAVEKTPSLEKVGSFSNPLEALEMMRKGFGPGYVQLLLMDIDMPVINGLEFFQSLADPPLGIFITAHPEYALESYDVHAFDFLTKPLRMARFEQAIGRVQEFLEVREKARLYDVEFASQFMVVKEGNHIIRILFHEVFYLEALKDYTKIVTAGKQYLTLSNLKTFSERLPPDQFMRIHRSFSVAVNKIRKMEQHELLLEKFRLPVGKTFRKDINEYLLRQHS